MVKQDLATEFSSERGDEKDLTLIPVENTIFLEEDNLTIAGTLQKNGYKTIHLGKWHVSKNPLKQGIDINIGGDKTGSPVGQKYTGLVTTHMTHSFAHVQARLSAREGGNYMSILKTADLSSTTSKPIQVNEQW